LLTAEDYNYESLYAWLANGDGICTEDEMKSFSELDIEMNLASKKEKIMLKNGNIVANKITFSISGVERIAHDVFLYTKLEEVK
ncbi:hypothetical protein, partial [Shewanella schlegeliana]